MICAVMQPTYFPWAGYFGLIERADVFIFLDDVQFERSSWQNRNRILLQGKPHIISVPTKRSGLLTLIRDVYIQNEQNWAERHLKTISGAYSKKPFFKEMMELAEGIRVFSGSEALLAQLNISLIRQICSKLEIKTQIHLASEMQVTGERSERLIGFCKALGCSVYLSPPGAKEYLQSDGDFERSDVQLNYFSFQPEPYFQGYNQEFVSHLSILDVIANLGFEKTAMYIKTAPEARHL